MVDMHVLNRGPLRFPSRRKVGVLRPPGDGVGRGPCPRARAAGTTRATARRRDGGPGHRRFYQDWRRRRRRLRRGSGPRRRLQHLHSFVIRSDFYTRFLTASLGRERLVLHPVHGIGLPAQLLLLLELPVRLEVRTPSLEIRCRTWESGTIRVGMRGSKVFDRVWTGET